MDEMYRGGEHSSDGSPGPSRPMRKKDGRDKAGPKAKTTGRLLAGSPPAEPARHVESFQGVADESSEDDYNPWPYRRGHDYRNVQARENGRMQLGDNTHGDNTYIRQQIVYSEQRRRSGGGEEANEIDLLDALAFEQMGARLASISAAQDRTCRWLFDTSEYVQWRQGFWRSRYRFLWIKGKPGSGKSTLMATAFQQASCDFKRSIVASFFFNARGDELGRTTEGMYRSLLHQISSQLPELPSGIPSRVSTSLKQRGWALPMLQNMLRTTVLNLKHGQSLVCYVDALDECAEQDIRDAIQHLEELRDLAKARNLRFLICFASRHYPNITILYHRVVNLGEQAEHRHDISRYVNATLRVPGTLGIELHDSVMSRCRKIFLWVVLTVRSLNKMYDTGGTRSQLQLQMKETPEEVQDLFRGLLQEKDEYLLPILQWVLYARRALNVQELYFAVIASTGRLTTGEWDHTEIDRPRMQSFLMASSRGLLEFWEDKRRPMQVREPASYAQLIHESLREYLFASGLLELDHTMGRSVEAMSHGRLAEWCVDYVAADSDHYGSEDLLLHGLHNRFPLLHYIMINVVSHLKIAHADNVLPSSTLGKFARLCLASKLDRLSRDAREDCATLIYFSLARQGQRYQKEGIGTFQAPKPYDILSIRFTGDRWTGWHDASLRSVVLQAAACTAQIDLAPLFYDRSACRQFFNLVKLALEQSAIEGNDNVLDLLLRYVATTKTDLARGLLRIAALNLRESTTRLLLRQGAQPNQRGSSIMCSLARAEDPLRCGDDPVNTRNAIATLLLDNGACTKGAILSASRAGRTRLAQLLVARGATISRSAVRKAREKGRRNIINIVDEAGATIGDSTADSVDTSDASTAAVNGNQW